LKPAEDIKVCRAWISAVFKAKTGEDNTTRKREHREAHINLGNPPIHTAIDRGVYLGRHDAWGGSPRGSAPSVRLN